MTMVLPQEEVTAPVAVNYENILENISRANAQVEKIIHSAVAEVLALSVLILLGVPFFAEIRSCRIMEPITRLMKEVAVIG